MVVKDFDTKNYIGTFFNEGVEPLRKLTDEIIASLPKEKQAGGLVYKNEDWILYVGTTCIALVYFFAVYFAAHKYAKKYEVKEYCEGNA